LALGGVPGGECDAPPVPNAGRTAGGPLDVLGGEVLAEHDHDVVQPASDEQLAPGKVAEVTGMQLYCMQLARLEETGRLSDTIAGLAKLNNTRKARQVIAEARDLLGGNGVLLENHVIRHMGDIEVIHTYEGTETMQTLIVGRDITGVGAFA